MRSDAGFGQVGAAEPPPTRALSAASGVRRGTSGGPFREGQLPDCGQLGRPLPGAQAPLPCTRPLALQPEEVT